MKITRCRGRSSWAVLLLPSVAGLLACTEARDLDDAGCPSYDHTVRRVLDAECLACHRGAEAAAGYSVESPADLWARSLDGTPRIVAGEASSLLLQKVRGEASHPKASHEAGEVLTRWVVDCKADPLPSEVVHARGLLDRASPDFHGSVLRNSGWSFETCARCHGAANDPSGGPSGRSCVSCHRDGATSCTTCHGSLGSVAPPPALDGSTATTARGVGAHRMHLTTGPTMPTAVACSECHTVPSDWRAPGHIFSADGRPDGGPAEVVFGGAASRSLKGFESRRSGPPSYDVASGSCTNVYCHGAALGAAGKPAPVWTEVSVQASCTRCHDLPPAATHAPGLAASDCATCHGLVVDASGAIKNPSLHGDGKLSLGDGSESCSACHGGPANAAPVGTHQRHLNEGPLAGKQRCDACHEVPAGSSYWAAVTAPGHLDTLGEAEVFPGGAAFRGLAAAGGATPSYDAATGTCSGVYCHGGGARFAADPSSSIVRTLPWSAPATVACGSCHSLPPELPGHPAVAPPLTCATCHPLSVDASGSIIIRPNGTSTHVNGVVNQ
jgi:predicted CxxxxCH...CXXCH cytochrome family protein